MLNKQNHSKNEKIHISIVGENDSDRKVDKELKKTISFKKKLSICKKKYFEWSENTTSHAYPNLFRTNKLPIRIFWLILLVVSSALCLYVLVDAIIAYQKFDTISRITIENLKSLELPAISICNSDPFPTDEAKAYFYEFVKNNPNNFYDSDLFLNNSTSKNDFYKKNQDQIEWFKNFVANPNFNPSLKKKFGFDLNSMFVYKAFSNALIDNGFFEWFYDLNYGNCFILNSGILDEGAKVKLIKQQEGGFDQGFFLVIYSGTREINRNSIVFKWSYGPKIAIGDQNQIRLFKYDFKSLKTGTCTYIALKKLSNKNEQFPYSACRLTESIKESKYFNEFVKRNKAYQQRVCVDMCIQDMIISKCSCSSLNYELLSTNTQYCSSFDQVMCVNSFIRSLPDEKKLECLNEKICPLECESINFEISSSYDSFPHPGYHFDYLVEYLNIDSNNITFDELSESLSCVYIYYEELKHSKIEQTPSKIVVELLADLGGTMGLFLGVSLLSFCEVFELIIELIYILVGKTGTKQNKELKEEKKETTGGKLKRSEHYSNLRVLDSLVMVSDASKKSIKI